MGRSSFSIALRQCHNWDFFTHSTPHPDTKFYVLNNFVKKMTTASISLFSLLYKEIQEAGRPELLWRFHKISRSVYLFCISAPPSLIPIFKVPIKLTKLQIKCPHCRQKEKIEKKNCLNVLLIQNTISTLICTGSWHRISTKNSVTDEGKWTLGRKTAVSDVDSHFFIAK